MIEQILDRLPKVQNRGKQKWMACCPAHDDKSPSLSITQSHDGKILMRCFAGCDVQDIMVAIGMRVSDLFPDDGKEWKSTRSQKNIEHEKLILEIAEADRKSGHRLSEKDLQREREAYMRLRNANHNG